MPAADPRNVDGPFYVEAGCCTACGVPEATAPSLFDWGQDNSCFVKRQPATKDELNQMLRTLMTSELGCIRYRGADPSVTRRIAEFGEVALCDIPPDTEIKPIVWNRAEFEAGTAEWTSIDCATFIVDCLRLSMPHVVVSAVSSVKDDATFLFTWQTTDNYRVVVHQLALQKWRLQHDHRTGVSAFIHESLVARGATNNLRWLTTALWATHRNESDVPW